MLRLSNAMVISFLLIFLQVFQLRDINIEPIIPFGSIWQVIIITAAFILSLIAGRAPINSKSFVFLGLVTVFFIWSLAVSLNSGEPQLSLQRLLLLFIATYLVFIAVLSLKDVELFISTFFKGIVFFVLMIGVLALVVNTFGTLKIGDKYSFKVLEIGPFSFKQAVMGTFLRTGGYFGNANSMSKWVVFLLPFLFMLFHNKKITKLQFFVIFFFFLSMLIVALSRAGMALAFISCFIYWYLYSNNYKRKLLMLFIALVCAFFAITLFLQHFGDTSRGSLDLNSRGMVWMILMQSIEENPLTGIGFGVTRESILKPNSIEFAAHNFYIEKLVEVGLIGLLLALIPFLYVMIVSYRNLKNSSHPFERSFNSATISFLVTFLLYLNVETGLFIFSMWHVFIVIVSSLVLNFKKEKQYVS